MKIINFNDTVRKSKTLLLKELCHKFKEDYCICFEKTDQKIECDHVVCIKCLMKIDKCLICREHVFYRIHMMNKKLMDMILNKYSDFLDDYGGIIDFRFFEYGRILAFSYINFYIRNRFYRISNSLP